MSDEPPRRPPRVPRPPVDDDEIVHVEEGPATEKLRPKMLVPVTRAASIAEVSAQLSAVQQHLSGMAMQQTKQLELQRKMALQADGFQNAVNQRFDLFHEELAMLRQLVSRDHAPRLAKVEASLGQKAAKGGGIVAVLLLVLPMLADALPKYAGIIDAISRVLH